ncbi:hypothetical protein F511_03427 [Dorcoceras hygrometricum]|uniref:BRCT domain-containing protein n=1 Tax=Dorcoceras hygrometricum TaxID=472368 RepID=A0A2Z7DDH5_9LAMI|nr:hypothetical protein F511_03427 [Dorcoceras hygrometricum]
MARTRRSSSVSLRSSSSIGDYYYVLANATDVESQTRSLVQEALSLYSKELPAMNYAANSGKKSMFLQRCVTNGKYCTLMMKSKDVGEVIAAITYQIIPVDTLYAEIPLAAVSSDSQNKGFGSLLFFELEERLLSVGVRTLLCWGDRESEGFWIKLGFTVIGEVNEKGRARRLPIKAGVRRALCFPGGSTLMVSHIFTGTTSKVMKLSFPPVQMKHPGLTNVTDFQEPCKEEEHQRTGSGYSGQLGLENFSNGDCPSSDPLPPANCCVVDANGVKEAGAADDLEDCSCSVQGSKKRIWETSSTSLKSKKVKGTHSNDCQVASQCPVWTSDGRKVNFYHTNPKLFSEHKLMSKASPENSGSKSTSGKYKECKRGNMPIDDYSCPLVSHTEKCVKVMLMNIADDGKRSSLTKIIEDMGGVVTSNGSESTHVVTGKARKTFNFCIALCSGCWVISAAWLKVSFRKGRFVDEMPFILKDDDYITKFRCDLKSAVLRAKANPNALLKGLDIWPATHVQPPASTLSAIIMSAGGNVIRESSDVVAISKTIFLACEEDMEEVLAAVKMGILTFSMDWFMNCIMKQELDLEATKFAESL